MDTIAHLHDRMNSFETDQKEIIKSITGLSVRLSRQELMKDFYKQEIDEVKTSINKLAEIIKEMNDNIRKESKENQKFKNYGTAIWLGATTFLSLLIAFLMRLFFSKP